MKRRTGASSTLGPSSVIVSHPLRPAGLEKGSALKSHVSGRNKSATRFESNAKMNRIIRPPVAKGASPTTGRVSYDWGDCLVARSSSVDCGAIENRCYVEYRAPSCTHRPTFGNAALVASVWKHEHDTARETAPPPAEVEVPGDAETKRGAATRAGRPAPCLRQQGSDGTRFARVERPLARVLVRQAPIRCSFPAVGLPCQRSTPTTHKPPTRSGHQGDSPA